MQDLLKRYILEVIEETRRANVAQQLLPKDGENSDSKSRREETSDEIEEVSLAANIAGYTAPLGAPAMAVGEKPVKPGKKFKGKKKEFIRWK